MEGPRPILESKCLPRSCFLGHIVTGPATGCLTSWTSNSSGVLDTTGSVAAQRSRRRGAICRCPLQPRATPSPPTPARTPSCNSARQHFVRRAREHLHSIVPSHHSLGELRLDPRGRGGALLLHLATLFRGHSCRVLRGSHPRWPPPRFHGGAVLANAPSRTSPPNPRAFRWKRPQREKPRNSRGFQLVGVSVDLALLLRTGISPSAEPRAVGCVLARIRMMARGESRLRPLPDPRRRRSC